MILSRREILTYLKAGTLRFHPEVSTESVAQVSIDLRLGRKFTRFKDEPPAYLTSIHVDPSLWDSKDIWEHSESDTYLLRPGKFVLAQTLERVRIPNDLVGLVEGRSSYARVGITIHITAPKIDPGFDGHITLEMANFGNIPVELRAEVDRPAQLILVRLTSPLGEGEAYGSGEADTFQYQEDPIPRNRGHDPRQ